MHGHDAAPSTATLFIERTQLDDLFRALQTRGYRVIGPTKRDQAIVYEELDAPADLPAGWIDVQAPGAYRLTRRDDEAVFGHAVGPHSWKRYLHPPLLRLLAARRGESGQAIDEQTDDPPRYAFFGVRACDLTAIARQDQVFLGGAFVDGYYRRRRARAFIVAVNCTSPAGTCFCASMEAGPRVDGAFDLALTELVDPGRHAFTVTIGSERGREVMHEVPHREATREEVADAGAWLDAAVRGMGRTLQTDGLRHALTGNPEHPRWDDVAKRCLTCGNCTMACPTCFCTTVDDTVSLTGDRAERWRKWDTCFSVDFSYISGGSVRLSPRSRYRQWLTHKLATWYDQFGVSGCVGCGRCITWCPVGIDITVEARAIREAGAGTAGGPAPESSDAIHRATAG